VIAVRRGRQAHLPPTQLSDSPRKAISGL